MFVYNIHVIIVSEKNELYSFARKTNTQIIHNSRKEKVNFKVMFYRLSSPYQEKNIGPKMVLKAQLLVRQKLNLRQFLN